MELYQSLKSLWKKLGIKGSVKNYSNADLWVLETDTTGRPIARILSPGYKTPRGIDCDAFKRKDGKAIQGHKDCWKLYDFSIAEVFSDGKGLRVSVFSKTAVSEKHFGEVVKYINEKWGEPLTVILDTKRGRTHRIESYYVSGHGWLNFETTLLMTCRHEIDNAQPVFPRKGNPYIRSKRDKIVLNNFSKKSKT